MKRELKILIVDDNPDSVEILEEIIAEKYVYRVAMYGEQAVRIAKKFVPDIILLDIMLPDINGLWVCKAIRKNPNLRHCKIILQSAKTDLIDRIEGLQSGADDYLCKPYESEEILELIEREWTNDLYSELPNK